MRFFTLNFQITKYMWGTFTAVSLKDLGTQTGRVKYTCLLGFPEISGQISICRGERQVTSSQGTRVIKDCNYLLPFSVVRAAVHDYVRDVHLLRQRISSPLAGCGHEAEEATEKLLSLQLQCGCHCRDPLPSSCSRQSSPCISCHCPHNRWRKHLEQKCWIHSNPDGLRVTRYDSKNRLSSPKPIHIFISAFGVTMIKPQATNRTTW